LNYYTGVIVEVVCNAVKMGSIGGGGRYDDLTGLFGLKNLSGVGVSFGIDRIYDVIEELNLFPQELAAGAKVLLLNFGGENELYALKVLQQLREAGIASEIYPDAAKFDKQMKYANKRGIAYVILPGDEEREKQMLSLKDFTTGEQQMLTLQECIARLTA
jgi:histidyl-tRNA synthetase